MWHMPGAGVRSMQASMLPSSDEVTNSYLRLDDDVLDGSHPGLALRRQVSESATGLPDIRCMCIHRTPSTRKRQKRWGGPQFGGFSRHEAFPEKGKGTPGPAMVVGSRAGTLRDQKTTRTVSIIVPSSPPSAGNNVFVRLPVLCAPPDASRLEPMWAGKPFGTSEAKGSHWTPSPARTMLLPANAREVLSRVRAPRRALLQSRWWAWSYGEFVSAVEKLHLE